MILYDPVGGDVSAAPIKWLPRTCFLMTRLGQVPPFISTVREHVTSMLNESNYGLIDASSATTGRDYLNKIWRLIVGVPAGIAIVYNGMPIGTMGNVCYEIGLMQALGKETLIVKESDATIPSDFVRTEYVTYDKGFEENFLKFIDYLGERAESFDTMAQQLEHDPLLAIDYYRRAYLLSGEEAYQQRTRAILSSGEIGERAKDSVEFLAAGFCKKKKGATIVHPVVAVSEVAATTHLEK